MIKVKVVREFLEIPIGTIGIITTQYGEPLEVSPISRAMWIKLDQKDMPVGIPEPFGLHIAIQKQES